MDESIKSGLNRAIQTGQYSSNIDNLFKNIFGFFEKYFS